MQETETPGLVREDRSVRERTPQHAHVLRLAAWEAACDVGVACAMFIFSQGSLGDFRFSS